VKSQVLLSCSHSFHRACLSSFEQLATNRCGRSCPVCRSLNYEKKAISDGYEEYLNRCAAVIQSNWRRLRAYKQFSTLWEQAPAPAHANLREKWALNRLGNKSDKLLRAMEDEVGDLDAFFKELEQQHAEAGGTHTETYRGMEAAARDCKPEKGVGRDGPGDVDWKAVHRTASLRGQEDCSICMMPLRKHWRSSSQCSLLSCSHCFHTQCIAAFEAFQADRSASRSCPVCREFYLRRQLKQQRIIA
jgi:hypothetical protein